MLFLSLLAPIASLCFFSFSTTAFAEETENRHPYIVVFKDQPMGALFNGNNDCQSVDNQLFYCVFDDLDDVFLNQYEDMIEYIEEDQVLRYTDHFGAKKEQSDAPWGVARVSHPTPSNASTYRYFENDGLGVTVYVIDTGVYAEHDEFKPARVKTGLNLVAHESDTDNNGHGTHVMGTVLGNKYGIAKKATGVAIKVLDRRGSGTLSNVIKGIEYVIEQHKLVANASSVINMSLGGGKSPTLEKAVQLATHAGIAVVVAAGNENQDACKTSPAGSPFAISVGATTKLRDARVYFSNYGPCVDIYAPGHMILSAWNSYSSSTNTISGTSMASPHVAGVVAALMSRHKSNYSKSLLFELARENIVPNENQRFLYNGFDEYVEDCILEVQ